MNPDHSETLVKKLGTSANDLIAELQAVRDSVEELYILLDHISRNREELRSILESAIEERIEKQGEAVCCVHCDAWEVSVAAAVREGWTRLQAEDSADWDFLGVCPGCERKRDEEDRRRQGTVRTALEIGLTHEQTVQAVEEGVTTALGLRRVEKNTRGNAIPETTVCPQSDFDSPAPPEAGEQEGGPQVRREGDEGVNGRRERENGQTQEVQGRQRVEFAEKATGQRELLFDTPERQQKPEGKRPRRRRGKSGR